MIEPIAQTTIVASSLGHYQASLSRLQQVQEQVTSGRRIGRPSDDPLGAAAALYDRAAIRRAEQYARNADNGSALLHATDVALSASLTAIRRVRELAIEGGDDRAGPATRATLAAKVDERRDVLLTQANTMHLDQLLFAGTARVVTAYNGAGDYLGDSGHATRTVAKGVMTRVSVAGPETYGTGKDTAFHVLSILSAHLRRGQTDDIRAHDLGAIDAARSRLQNTLATVRSLTEAVHDIRDRTQGRLIELRRGLSSLEDVDLLETTMNLQMQWIAYQAALGATVRVVQPSLANFLR